MKKSALKNITAILILAAALLLPGSAFAAGPAPSAGQLNAVVRYGFDNTAKGGRYLPIHIDLQNAGAEFRGNISIYTRESDGEIYEYSHAVMIPGQADSSISFNIPIALDAGSILVKISDGSGAVLFRETVQLNIEKNNAQLYVGVLSDTPEKLSYLNDVSVNYGLLRTKVLNLSAENFPEDSIGLDLLDCMVITNYRLRDLSEAQCRALMDWVREGGVMLLGTGERIDDTLGRFAPELLDEMYEEPEEMEIQILSNTGMDDPSAGCLDLFCAEVILHGGNVIAKSNGIPVLTSVNKESGAIVVAAYDFAALSDFAALHPEYASDLFSRTLGSGRIEKLAGEMYGADNYGYLSVSKVVNTGDVDRLPPIGIYAFSILAYILLAGPGMYLFLKHRDLTKYYRMGVIVLSAFFTLIVYLMGSRTRFEGPFYNYASIMDANDDSINETSYLNLRSPYDDSYHVDINPEYAIYPVTNNTQLSSGATDWNDPVESNVSISYADNATSVAIKNIGAFASRFFQLEKSGENVDKLGFTGSIGLFGTQISGEITNNFRNDMKNAVLLSYGHMVLLGEIKAGETVSLEEKKVVNIPLSDSRAVAEIISGLRDYEGDTSLGSEYLTTVEKANILEFYRDYYMKGYTADARILGFPEGMEHPRLVDGNVDGFGMTMVTSSLPISNRQDNRIYKSLLITNPTVISGNYAPEDNTMTTIEPVILEYHIGNDIDLIDVIFEWVNADEFRNVFTGTIAFYNYSSGAYESIDPGKTVFTKKDLQNFLPPSNTLTVKYTYTGAASPERVSLPMLSITGNEE